MNNIPIFGDVIPEWDSIPIAKLGSVITGNTPDTKIREYYDGAIPFVSPSDIGITTYIRSTSKKLSKGGLTKTRAIPKNSVMVVCIGSTIGKVGISSYECATNQQINSVLCNENNDSAFVFYSMSYLAPFIKLMASTQAVPIINKTEFGTLLTIKPPLPEQQKIAQILTSVDEVIEKTQAQIDKLKDLKTAMMQELLTKGIGHVEFKDSPVGRIPVGWEVCKAEEMTSEIMVGVVIKPTQYYVESGVPALRSANVRESGLTFRNMKYFSNKSNDLLKKSKLQLGDLLTVRTGYPGTTAVVTKEFVGTNCIDVVIVRPSEKIDSDYLSMWINSDNGKGQVLKAQGGLAQQHFNVGDMRNLLVAVPSLEEQRKIFDIVNAITKKIQVTGTKQLLQLNTKKALMQDLLTGKVRVKVS
jgi:type I restriction enzyme S subunit